jgi:hypothetical protein
MKILFYYGLRDQNSIIFKRDFIICMILLLQLIHSNVIDLHSIIFCFSIPSWQPFVAALPEFCHLSWIGCGPRFLVIGILATVGEEIASNSDIK